jgi:nucleotide-binding universal stress UspA family protein
LKYGLEKVKEKGARLIVLHVFHRGMFIDYHVLPGAEDIARRESFRCVEDAKRIIEEAGEDLRAKVVVEEGNPEEEIIKCAEVRNIDLIVSPPRYRAVAKKAACPVSIVPGCVLVPLDNIENFMPVSSLVIKEAKAAGSKVALLGIVPIHMYGLWERRELRDIEQATSAALVKAKDMLHKEGIETREFIRPGYPDEEITKAADQLPVSLIIIPAAGGAPSELRKTARMLIDDPDKFKRPLFLAEPEKAAAYAA